MHNPALVLPALPALVLIRVALVVFAFMVLISYQRRKRILSVVKELVSTPNPIISSLVSSDLRENRLQLIVFGFFAACCLAYLVYTILVPTAVAG